MRADLILAGLLVLVYAVLCAALYLRQRALIYYPTAARLTEKEVLRLSTPQGDVLVSQWAHAGSKALLYFGGNAEEVSSSLPTYVNAFPDIAVYGLHYRGYGGSAGSPSEEAIKDDALKLYDQVVRSHPEVMVVGRSLGSGVAVWLASQRRVSKLILITPYHSLQEIAAGQFPYFPVRWLLEDKYESWRDAPAVSAPTLILAAERDEVIPMASSRALATAFKPGHVKFEVVAEAHHNTISDHPEFSDMLRAFRDDEATRGIGGRR